MTIEGTQVNYKFKQTCNPAPEKEGSVVKEIQCWEGSNNTLHRNQADAAISLITNTQNIEFQTLLKSEPIQAPRTAALKDAILWVADKLREKPQVNKPKTMRKKGLRSYERVRRHG